MLFRSANLWANLRDNLRDNLWDNLWDNLRANLRANLWDNLKDNLGDKLQYHNEVAWGQLDAPWIAFYLFGEKIGIKYQNDKSTLLHLWGDLAKSCFWWWAFDGICFISARPTEIKKDARGRLHADGEMACAFKDGWGVYANSGVTLPEKYGTVKIADWKAEWILEEQNQELRRLLLENIPSEKVGEVLQLKSISKFKSIRSEYELVEAKNNPYPSRYRALRFKCPTTERPYLVRVHPDTDTAEAAIVSLNKGVHPDQFIWEH